MKLYKFGSLNIVEHSQKYFGIEKDWDELINRENLYDFLKSEMTDANLLSAEVAKKLLEEDALPPIGSQEVWAAGVTYMRSRNARMEESKESGGANFYDKVYVAERPELFFKSFSHRVAGHNQQVYIRKDSSWNVPEPELTLFINSTGKIQGYTIGNDMSSRSIEGENPLYLPQAKMYDRSAALGPCLFVTDHSISQATQIHMQILRNDKIIYDDSVEISRMKRSFNELIDFLYREYSFPDGSFLMTGTCLVPANDFTLLENDRVVIAIDNIGTLANTVAFNPR